MKNKTIYLKDYKVPVYLVDSLDLEFDIFDDYTEVTSVAKYRKNTDSKEENILTLDGTHQELISVELDWVLVDPGKYELTDTSLIFYDFPEEGSLKIVSKIDPANNTALEGLYASGDLLCTQCESHGFRRITYYLDRPDVMTLFTTKIIADKKKYPELLSNGNLVDSGDLDEERHYRVWEDPFKKPSYLFALVTWDLEKITDTFTTASGKVVDLEIFATKENISKCDFAMGALKRAMKWDEERFGREYDLDLFMIVGVDDFNSGAMENKGLNIFNSALIFATPETATDRDYVYIEAVIWHEYFHNWTGDRVTCRDWFQLSLKEGLTVFRDAEFTSDLHSRSVKRIEDVNVLRNHQFKEDASPMAHPIRPASFEEISNFYTVTVYEKWAEIIKIYETLLGVEGFRKWMDLYFERHDWQAVTTEDFLKAMADVNDRDLSQIQNWYDQAGTPVVEVTDSYDTTSQIYTLHMKQSCPKTPESSDKKPFIIPVKVGLLYEDGNEHALQDDVLVLTESEQTFTFEAVTSKPRPSLLRGFSAPVRLKYNYSIEDYIFLMKHDSDEFNRFEATRNFGKHVLISWENEAEFLDALAVIVSDSSIDNSIKTEMLSLPSETELADEIWNDVNPEEIHYKREALIWKIAEKFEVHFREIYDSLLGQGEYKVESGDIANRSLKNLCLYYLGYIENSERAYNQYKSSNNMTDESAAFRVLLNGQGSHRTEAIAHFIEKWRDDTNVVDKWFSMQAMSPQSDINAIKKLITHEAFDIKNPNKVRSVYNVFANYNLVNFHKADGSGYEFVADGVIQLDKINPAIAARLVKTLISWKQLESSRSHLLKNQLQRISEVSDLSPDVSEIVLKSL